LDSTVDINNRIRDGRINNSRRIQGRKRECFSFLNRLHRLSGPPSLLFSGYRRVKSAGIEAVHSSSYCDEVNVWIRTCTETYNLVARTGSAYRYFLLFYYLISLVTGVCNVTLFFCDGVRLAVWNFSPSGPLSFFLAHK
jgi:hypothetical protein